MKSSPPPTIREKSAQQRRPSTALSIKTNKKRKTMDSLNISPSNIQQNEQNKICHPDTLLGSSRTPRINEKSSVFPDEMKQVIYKGTTSDFLRKIMSTIFFYCYLHEKVFLSLEKLQQCHIAGLLKKLLSSKMKRMLPYSNNTTTNAYGILTSVLAALLFQLVILMPLTFLFCFVC